MLFLEYYDSLQKFANTLNSRETNKVFLKRPYLGSQLEAEAHVKNATTSTYTEADKLLFAGDSSNLSKIKECKLPKFATSKNDYAKTKLKIERSVCGCLPNIPLYLIGSPANMLNFKKVKLKTKTIDILINVAISCGVEQSAFVEIGAKVAAIIRRIEKNGIRVNLFVGCLSESGGDIVGVLINIKKNTAPLNMLNITYPLINPSMVRRHFLRYLETLPQKINKGFAKGYGFPIKFDKVKNLYPAELKKYADYYSLDYSDILSLNADEIINKIINK